ncbi:hypothetical protein D9M68_410820 [compost metagenome]
MLKRIFLAALLASASQATLAEPTVGTIRFKGKVQDTTCSVSVDGVETPNLATVLLYEAPIDWLVKPGDVSKVARFDIELMDCEGPSTQVRASFQGANGTTVTEGRLDNMAANNPARNVQLMLVADHVMPEDVEVGGDQSLLSPAEIKGGSARLQYAVSYYATGPVTEGNFEAAVEYTVAYQ